MKGGTKQSSRGGRRWLRRILILFLSLLLPGAAVFLLRKPLFSDLVLAQIRSLLSEELGVAVQANALDGNWWTEFELKGLSFSDARGPLRSLRDATIQLRLQPLQLPGRGLRALRSLKIQATYLELAISDATARAENKGGASANQILAELFPLFPDGILIEVEDLALGTRSGTARLEVDAVKSQAGALDWPQTRDLEIRGPGVNSSLRIQRAHEESWAITAQGRVENPGDALQDLGSDLAIQGGTAEIRASLDSQGFAKGRLSIEGLRFEGAELDATQLDFEIRDQQVRISQLQVELPGLQIHARDLLIPKTANMLTLRPESWQGSLSIWIQDLEPYRTQLPKWIRERLPIEGRLDGRLDAGRLILSRAELRGQGISVGVEKGLIPILGNYREKRGELHGHVEVVDAIAIDVAPLGRIDVTGSFEGRCTGSLDQPILEGRLDARARTERGLVQIKGRAHSAAGRHSLEEMSMSLSASSAPSSPASMKTTDGTSRETPPGSSKTHTEPSHEMKVMGSLTLDSALAQGEFQLAGNLDSRTLEALGLLPVLPRHVTASSLDTRASFTFGKTQSLDARLSLEGIQSEGKAVGQLRGRVSWEGGEEILVREFVIRPQLPERQEKTPKPGRGKQGESHEEVGNVLLEAEGRIPLAQERTWDLTLRAENLSLDFIGPFLSISLPRSRLDLSARVQGPLNAPSFSVDTGGYLLQHVATQLLVLSDEQIRHLPQLPLRFRARLQADPHQIRVEQLQLSSGEGSEMLRFEGQGRLPFGTTGIGKEMGADLFQAEFRYNHDLDLAASIQGHMRLDKQGLAIGPLTIAGPDGLAQGKLRLDFAMQELMAGKVSREQVSLSGKLLLQRIDMGKIPRSWIKDLDLTGMLDGELTLNGSLAQPEPRMKLELENVGLKVRGAPRVESFGGEILLQQRSLQVRRMKGRIGVGHFVIKGGLQTKGLLWEDIDKARLDLRLEGKDLMLVRARGLRILGDTRLILNGTPQKMHVGGEVAVESGKYNERQSLLMIDPSRRGGTSVPGFVPFRLDGELGKRVDFNVKLTTTHPFLIRTGLVNADVNAQLRLQGPGSKPYLVGAVTALRGSIGMPAAKLRLEQALIFFKKERPHFPELEVAAVYRRKGHEIRMRVQGSYDRPSLLLNSSPHLDYEQIIVFLSTGQLPKDLQGTAMESMLLAAGSYGANELWAWMIDSGSTDEEGEGFLDRFSFETGQDFGTSGIESMRVEYKLSPKWFLQVERDADGFYNMGVVFRITF